MRVARLEVRRSRVVPTPVACWMTNVGLAPTTVLSRVFGVAPSALGSPDLIVSAGGDTLAANIAAARLTGASNIFFGSLRRYRASDITLALNAYETDQAANNQLRILKPSPFDPVSLPVADLDHRRLPKVSGLLIGGPSGDARYEERDWTELLQFLDDTRVRLGMTWIVSNSRRTPREMSERLSSVASSPGGPIRQYIDVRTAGSGSLSQLFAETGAVAVTADSSAMLSEAIWMRRHVVALSPRHIMLPPKEKEYRRWLEGRNLFREVALGDITSERYASALRQVVPLSENPQAALADVLVKALPDLLAPASQPA